jgi:heat-inducible transcriptional repressor
MIHNLTQRQIDILKSIIEEYINSAQAVGSETIEKKYNLSASPATIRNEMVKLTELGFLEKPHASAGRIPTAVGMRLYVKELMKTKQLSTVEEVALKEKVWDYRSQLERFLKEATKSLAQKTGTVAIATTDDGQIFCSGYANILAMPEFFDIDVTKALLSSLDEYEYFRSLFNMASDEDEVHIVIGDELQSQLHGPYGLVYTEYHTPANQKGKIGVIGPLRLNYVAIVPTVRYFGGLIEDIAQGW